MRKWLFCLVLVACSGEQPTQTKQQTVVKTHTLRVMMTDGVESNLSVGTHEFAEGTTVSYNFVPASGFKNLVVESGSSELPASGSLTMSGDKEIFASAEVTPTVPQAGNAVEEAAAAVYAAQDSSSIVQAFQTKLMALEALYKANPDSALTLARLAELKALDGASAADLDRVNAALSGTVFGNTGALLSASASAPKGITIFYVNGIYNSRDAAEVSRQELAKVVSEAGLDESVNVYGFYNASSLYSKDTKHKCLMLALERESYKALRACGWVLGGDVIEAKRQIATLINDLPPQNKESGSLFARIKLERTLGRKVLLVGHSQGALIVSEAMRLYERRDRCIGAIALASPVGDATFGSPFYSGTTQGFVVAGERAKDIILALGLNDFERLATDVSQASDKIVEGFSNPNLTVAYASVASLFEDIHLHLFLESYVAGKESRQKLVSLLQNGVTRLQNTSCDIIQGEELRVP